MRRRYFKKPFVKKEPQTRTNERIQAREIRVIGEDGNQLGIMSVPEAIAIAKESLLDLVEISPKAVPPVCKIMDFGKYQYQKTKKERQNKSKQKNFDIKGIRIRGRTNAHDLEFKRKQAETFLQKGNKLKIEITMRGREKAYTDLARKNLEEFIHSITIPNKIEQEIKRYPGGFNVIIAPE